MSYYLVLVIWDSLRILSSFTHPLFFPNLYEFLIIWRMLTKELLVAIGKKWWPAINLSFFKISDFVFNKSKKVLEKPEDE